MRKLLLCLFVSVCSIESFANDIAANITNPVCDNATLSKYNGTANVEINWEPNTIELRWYSDDVELNVPIESQSCTYDGAMYIPPQPTKTGYTFKGWTVHPEYDFSKLNADINGTYMWSRMAYHCVSGENASNEILRSCTDSDLSDLQVGEWKIQFEYGMIYGTTLCSSSSPGVGNAQISTPDESVYGDYCYCRATGFIPSGTTLKYVPLHTNAWVFETTLENCSTRCADWCACNIVRSRFFRSSLYTPASN